MSKRKKILIGLVICILILIFTVPMFISLYIYRSNFDKRFETYKPYEVNVEMFQGLKVQRYTFESNKGQQLVGYQYDKEAEEIKGIVIIAHGFGGGGHNSYIDVADYLASNGYIVFAYDATGNDESEGDAVGGMPQGIIDLDYTIRFVKEIEDLKELPIMLFGHSWGAYSSGAVLNIHPEVKGVVAVSGFNTSMDIIVEEGKRMVGGIMNLFVPYLSLIERVKFGKYATYNSMDGFENSDAAIMVIHSKDDSMISYENSFVIYKERFQEEERFHFIEFEHRGHNYIYHSDAMRNYQDDFNAEFKEYLDTLDGEFTPEIKEAYLNENLDKMMLSDLDKELMDQIVQFYDNSLE